MNYDSYKLEVKDLRPWSRAPHTHRFNVLRWWSWRWAIGFNFNSKIRMIAISYSNLYSMRLNPLAVVMSVIVREKQTDEEDHHQAAQQDRMVEKRWNGKRNMTNNLCLSLANTLLIFQTNHTGNKRFSFYSFPQTKTRIQIFLFFLTSRRTQPHTQHIWNHLHTQALRSKAEESWVVFINRIFANKIQIVLFVTYLLQVI